ncbi:Spectrin beta chain, brain 1, partial [Stegodyphus mimosarum]
MEENIPEAVVESLRRERLTVQKKTFTKWANVHLQKYDLHIDDLFHDIGDGLRLMKLLEALTGEKLGKPAKGSARINKIENVSRCLAFLHAKKMRLENISSEDIVDGKPHLILGLLWTVILRCEIWQHQQQVEDGNNDRTFIPPPMSQTQYPVQKIAKDSLLLWCQTKTDGYPNVKVRDFHRSWRDGLAFNALIHSHVPALVDFYALKPHEHIYNLENAFSVASKQLGIPRLLDPEDVDTDNPDEKSILVYVSTFSKGLANIKKGMTGGKRIANVLAKMMDIEKLKKEYQIEAGELLHWIQEKIESFAEMEPPKSLEDIQLEISNFKNYRIQEKPEKNDMKNEIEALLFAIQMKRLGKSGWSPPEESSPAAIEKAWEKLERAEHEHEFKIRNQLKEQERMENLAYKFELKHRSMNEYLKEMQKILTDPNYGANIKQADATFKKHEAIKAGILARDLRLQALFKIADVLEENDYRRKDEILEWKNDMESSWNYVLRLLEAYDERFSHLRQVMSSLEEMDTILVDMKQMQAEMNSEAEPLDVESSLQKQAVREVQIASWGEAIRRLVSKIDNNEKMKDAYVVQKQLSKLQQTHESLIGISNIRRDSLEELLKRNQQQENIEEMMAWVNEKQLYLTADINCKDLPSALHLQKLHKAVGMELKLRKDVSEDIRDNRLSKAIADLEQLWQKRGDQIAFTIEVYQYEADACECDSWISEELKLLESLDYGTDELTSEALLRRHARVEDEITAYASEIQRLLQEAEKICSSASDSLKSSSFGISVTSQLNKKFSPSSVRGGSEYQMTAIQQIGNHQTQVETNFSKLQSKCQERRKRLRHSTMYFRFKDGCVEIEKWLRKMERIIDQDDFENEEIEKCFQAYMTDIAAHGTMIENLKTLAETLETEKSDQAQTVKILFEDVNRRWQHLNELTNLKARNLKGFTSVLLAHRMCDEASAWLSERSKTETEVSAKDVTSFATLRRKQEAIERELTPGEERVKQALILSEK